jgi:hypothetical protein
MFRRLLCCAALALAASVAADDLGVGGSIADQLAAVGSAQFGADDAMMMMAGTGADSVGGTESHTDIMASMLAGGGSDAGSTDTAHDALMASMMAGGVATEAPTASPTLSAEDLMSAMLSGSGGDAAASSAAPVGGADELDSITAQLLASSGAEAPSEFGVHGLMGAGDGAVGGGGGDALAAAMMGNLGTGGGGGAAPSACMGGYVKDLALYAGCKRITGFLAIVDTALTTLDQLSDLESIDWSQDMQGPGGNGLVIRNNANLVNVKGLGKLTQVSGGVLVAGNPQLTSTAGLGENLQHIGLNDAGQSVVIQHNDRLVDLGTSWDLWQHHLPGTLTIEDNALLRQIEGLSGVFTIGGGLDISGSELASLDALSSLASIDGADPSGSALSIVNNANLQSIAGLRELQGVLAGAIDISRNAALRTLDGMQHVLGLGRDTHGVSLRIEENAVLGSLDGLSGVHNKLNGSIAILRNPELHALSGLQKISEVGADASGTSLNVQSNDVLANLLGFSGITAVGGAVTVEGNPSLESLDGLQNIQSVAGANTRGNSLEVRMNAALTDMNALQGLQGHLQGLLVEGNPNVGDVTALENGITSATDVTIKDVQCLSSADAALLDSIAQTTEIETPTGTAPCASTGGKAHTSVGVGRGEICGGTTTKGAWDVWSAYGSTGLFIDVDTTSCKLTEAVPRYVSSIVGDSAHWQLTGVNSIYEASSTGFRIYMWHPVLRGKFMKYFAARYNWRLSWLADAGQTSGITEAGKSGWKQVPKTKNAIYIDVNTEKSEYYGLPRYVTSIHGGRDHWKTQGVHSIYQPSRTGFRVFVVFPTDLTAQDAELHKWQIAWVGSEDPTTSGESASKWSSYVPTGRAESSQHKQALYIDVDTSVGHYPRTPTYVTAVSGHSHHWMVTGAASIYDPSKSSFRMYLDNTQSAAMSDAFDWKVTYIAFSDPIDCVHSPWGGWATCTRGCGSGTQQRTRTVVQQAYFGGVCDWQKEQTQACNTQACARECIMSPWTTLSQCSATCGKGTKTRTRIALQQPSDGGAPCPAAREAIACDSGPCPNHCEVSRWGAWSECTQSCGHGRQSRARVITQHADIGGFACPSLAEEQLCGLDPCPIDCAVGQWGTWDACSLTCGWGQQARVRTVLRNAAYGGQACPAQHTKRPCHESHCPQHCSVTAWGAWGECTTTCGRGTQVRSRTVITHAQLGGYLCPSLQESENCNVDPCPVNCAVAAWSNFGECTFSCGGGMQTRSRAVLARPAHGGLGCPLISDARVCNEQACPLDCFVHQWGAYSPCTTSCGPAGTKSRWRATGQVQLRGGKPCPATHETVRCEIPCPQHCQVASWGLWGTCTQTCGRGQQTRTRSVVAHDEFGGYVCPALAQSQDCNEHLCPQDCVQSAWGLWSPCTLSCGSGTQSRSRTVLQEPAKRGAFFGKPCEAATEMQACNAKSCAIDCAVSGWGAWGACSLTCGGTGTSKRVRLSLQEMLRGGASCPALTESKVCSEGPCPFHCQVSPWGAWSACSLTCGGGRSTRMRTITSFSQHGGFACPVLFGHLSCGAAPCPVDCRVSLWGSWSACSVSCGEGERTRTRVLMQIARDGGKQCGPATQGQVCNAHHCPVDCQLSAWGQWGACTTSCGVGSKQRVRFRVQRPSLGGRHCGSTTGTAQCNAGPCPVHCTVSSWSPWDRCTATCGGGRHGRKRFVQQGAESGGTCPPLHEERDCNTDACPVDCTVESWGPWAPFAGGGNKLRRTRAVKRASASGGKLCPALSESKSWHSDASATHVPWYCQGGVFFGRWSKCTKECGSGHRYQNKEHVVCSSSAVVKYHMKFRMGQRCNVGDCADGSGGHVRHVEIPPVVLGMSSVPEQLIASNAANAAAP